MSVLGGRLTASAGLGRITGVPAYEGNSTYAPATSSGASVGGPIGVLRQGAGDITQGKLTLAALGVAVVALTGFYIWTHKIQGGG